MSGFDPRPDTEREMEEEQFLLCIRGLKEWLRATYRCSPSSIRQSLYQVLELHRIEGIRTGKVTAAQIVAFDAEAIRISRECAETNLRNYRPAGKLK